MKVATYLFIAAALGVTVYFYTDHKRKLTGSYILDSGAQLFVSQQAGYYSTIPDPGFNADFVGGSDPLEGAPWVKGRYG